MSQWSRRQLLTFSALVTITFIAAVLVSLDRKETAVLPTAASAAVPASAANWGLSFPTEGQPPTW